MNRSSTRIAIACLVLIAGGPSIGGSEQPTQPASDAKEVNDELRACIEARFAGRLAEARSSAAKLFARLRARPRGDAERLEAEAALLDLDALVHASNKRLDVALKIATRAAQLAKDLPEHSPMHICPQLTLAGIHFEQGRIAEADDAILAAASFALRFSKANSIESNVVQSLVASRFWTSPVQQAASSIQKGETYTSAESRLKEQLQRVVDRLKKADLPAEVVAFSWLGLAHLQATSQRLDGCTGTLAAIAPFADDPKVAPRLRADYWTLCGILNAGRLDFSNARGNHEKALSIRRLYHLGDLAVAQSLNNLGGLLLQQGDMDAAFQWLNEANDLYRKSRGGDVQGQSYTLTNLAKVYEASGRLEEATTLHKQALAVAQQSPSSFDDLLCKNNLAMNHYMRGDLRNAESLFSDVRTQLIRDLGKDHLRVAECSVNLGWVALSQAQHEEAAKRFRSALDSLRSQQSAYHPRISEVESYLARALLLTGDREAAREHLREAIRSRNAFLERVIRSAMSERDRLAFVQGLRLHHEASSWPGVFDSYLELADELGVSAAAQYDVLLRWKGVVNRHALPNAAEFPEGSVSRSLAHQREAVLDRVRSAYFSRVTAKDLRSHQQEIARLEAKANDLERRLREATNDSAHDVPTTSDLATIQSVLAKKEAFVDIVEIRPYGGNHPSTTAPNSSYLAFVVRNSPSVVRVELGDGPSLNAQVVKLFGILSTRSGNYREPAAELGKSIREPLIPHLANIDSLVVCGDGFLHRLPLSMLPGSASGSVWLDEVAITWAPTAQSLVLRRRRSPSRASGMLVVADVDYGAPSSTAQQSLNRTRDGGTLRGRLWERLPSTKDEGREVAESFRRFVSTQGVDLLTGSNATEPEVSRLLCTRQYAHLATHGFFDFQQFKNEVFGTYDVSAALDSALILAGANLTKIDETVDNVLTAAEVERLDLRNVELMVLAACSTGLGHISAGQGTIGLLGALNQAGVRSTVSALWPVDDEATALLMAAFYRYHFAPEIGLDVAESLRRAQLDLIHERIKRKNGESLRHPFYWAPFIVAGDPSTQRPQNNQP